MRFRRALTLLMLVIGLVFTLPAWAQQKPMTQDQVQALVRDGFGDESGAKLLEQRGIDFAPADDFLQTLKTAGASEAFLQALRATKRPQAKGQAAKTPLNEVQIITLLAAQIGSQRVAVLVRERGIEFAPTNDYLEKVRVGGGSEDLISALKSANVTKPPSVDPALKARQVEARQHMMRGQELYQQKRYAESEAEIREALRLDPQNGDMRYSLAMVLEHKGDWDGAITEYREALRLNPDSDVAHAGLGQVLSEKGDHDGAIVEEREALRLNPSNSFAHFYLGLQLGFKGDYDGDLVEQREALRLNPDSDVAHTEVAFALASKGNVDEEITEFREAVRLNPNNEAAHTFLGAALSFKGDLDGAIAEERIALRLNPNSDVAHCSLGGALGGKGDWDGDIAEQREALRLDGKNHLAHLGLGVALEQKGNRQEALQEYRTAYQLHPDCTSCLQAYQRLLQQTRQ
jgi:tetratricopeptide (TPR) repeat protein